MVNPYQSVSERTNEAGPPTVRGFLIAAVLTIAIGSTLAIPGLFLLNQDLQIIPLDFYLTSFSTNGQTLSNATVMRISLVTGGTFLAIGLALSFIAWRNWQAIRKAQP